MRPAAAVLAVLTGLMLAACGAAPPVTVATRVAAPCQTGRVAVSVGRTVAVTGCPPGTVATVTGPLRRTGSYAFVATAVGEGDIALVQAPVCAPGTLCPQYRRALGRITVSVG